MAARQLGALLLWDHLWASVCFGGMLNRLCWASPCNHVAASRRAFRAGRMDLKITVASSRTVVRPRCAQLISKENSPPWGFASPEH